MNKSSNKLYKLTWPVTVLRLLALYLLVLSPLAAATVLSVDVSPKNTAVEVSTRLTLDATTSDSGTVRQYLAGALPPIQLSSNSFKANWHLVCAATGDTASAARGEFLLDGRTIAYSSTLPQQLCFPGGSVRPESVAIPPQAITAIRERILNLPVRIFTAGSPVEDAFSIYYRRVFRDGGGPARSDQVNIVFRIRINASQLPAANDSRLVSVAGEAENGLGPTAIGSAPTRVNWLASIRSSGAGKPLVIRSPRLEYRTPSGQLLDSRNIPLSQPFNPARLSDNDADSIDAHHTDFASARNPVKQIVQLAGSTAAALLNLFAPGLMAQGTRVDQLTFSESIALPASLLRKARQSGANAVILVRQFTDGSNQVSASVRIPIDGAAAAGFQLTRLALSYVDGSQVQVIDQQETLHALARLNYNGSGLLRAIWEIAPLHSAGAPLFRPLPVEPGQGAVTDQGLAFSERRTGTVVNEYLGQFQQISLRSPPLPTSAPGRYLLRLRVISPVPTFAVPLIEYHVDSDGIAALPAEEIIPMTVTLASTDDSFSRGTVVTWTAVGLTNAYRLEIYGSDSPDSPMLSGAVYPGNRDSAALSPLVADHLGSQAVYWLRVVAIDDTGRIHGASPLLKAGFRLLP